VYGVWLEQDKKHMQHQQKTENYRQQIEKQQTPSTSSTGTGASALSAEVRGNLTD